MTLPPEPFTLPVFPCPACGHGIDPHGIDPGGPCGVGDDHGERCACYWSPNDIATKVLLNLVLHMAVELDDEDRVAANDREDD